MASYTSGNSTNDLSYEFSFRSEIDPIALLDNAELGLHHHMSPADEEKKEQPVEA